MTRLRERVGQKRTGPPLNEREIREQMKSRLGEDSPKPKPKKRPCEEKERKSKLRQDLSMAIVGNCYNDFIAKQMNVDSGTSTTQMRKAAVAYKHR